jgi:hypothetical protein
VHPGRELRDNPRIVITNLRHRPERLYAQIYCARGDRENRLKELHHDLAFGRTYVALTNTVILPVFLLLHCHIRCAIVPLG